MRVYFRIANHYDFDDPEYSETNVEFSFSEYNKNDKGYMVNYSYEEFEFDEDIDKSVVEKIATTMVKEYNENGLSLIATYNREIANVELDNIKDIINDDLYDKSEFDDVYLRLTNNDESKDIIFNYLGHGYYNKVEDLILKVYYPSASTKVREYLKFLSLILINKTGSKNEKLNNYSRESFNSLYYLKEDNNVNPKAAKLFFEAPYNPKKEEKLLLKALKLGYLPAYKALGDYYKRNGDNKKALDYYLLGETYGDKDSILELANIYKGEDKEGEYLTKIYKYNDIEVLYRLANVSKDLKEECITRIVRIYLGNITNSYYLDWAIKEYVELLKNDDIYLAYLVAMTSKDKDLINKTREMLLNKVKENMNLNRINKEKEKKKKEEEETKKREKIELNILINDGSHWNKNERKSDYDKKVYLYKEALKSNNEESKLAYLIEAAKLNHSEAMFDLYNYYKSTNLVESFKYLVLSCEFKNEKALNEFKTLKSSDKNLLEYHEALILAYKDSKIARKELAKLSEKGIASLELYKKYYMSNALIALRLAKYYLYVFTEEKIERKYICQALTLDFDLSLDTFIEIIGYECDLNDEMFVNTILRNKDKHNAYIYYELSRIYSSESACEKYNLEYSLKTSFNYLVEAKLICKDDKLKRLVYLSLGNSHMLGLGTEENYNKAYDYFKDYDKELANKIYKDEKYKKSVAKISETTISLMNKYKCSQLEEFKKINKVKYERIINSYNVLPSSLLETRLKERDYLLSLGFSIDELYDYSGSFRAHELRNKNKVSQKEEEIRLKKQEDNIASNDNVSKVITNNKEELKESSNEEVDTKQDKLKELREELGYPSKVEFSSDPLLSSKQKEKLYQKQLESYKDELKQYKERLFEVESPYKGLNLSEVYKLLKDILKYDVDSNEFTSICKDKFNEVYKYDNLPDVEFIIKEEILDVKETLAIEKMLVGAPIKGGTLVIEAKVGLYSGEIVTLGGGNSIDYMYTLMKEFQESDLSKWGSWQDYSRSDSKVGASIYLKEASLKGGDYSRGKEICKNAIWNVIQPMFKQNKICCSKYIKLDRNHGHIIYFVPDKIKVRFTFPEYNGV